MEWKFIIRTAPKMMLKEVKDREKRNGTLSIPMFEMKRWRTSSWWFVKQTFLQEENSSRSKDYRTQKKDEKQTYFHIFQQITHKTNVKILSRINLRSIRYLFSSSLLRHTSQKKKLLFIFIHILISISFISFLSFSIFVACFLLLSAKFISYRRLVLTSLLLDIRYRCDNNYTPTKPSQTKLS